MIPHLTLRPQRGTQSQGFQGKHREHRFTVLSELETEQVSLCNRMAERRGQQNACMWQTWQGYYLSVMLWSSFNINVFWSLQKHLFKGKLFQTKLLPRLSHKVCCLLSSPVLLRTFTNIRTRTWVVGDLIVSVHCQVKDKESHAYSFLFRTFAKIKLVHCTNC